MEYTINVALNGKHVFCTEGRSLTTRKQADALFDDFKVRFPAREGFSLTLGYKENTMVTIARTESS